METVEQISMRIGAEMAELDRASYHGGYTVAELKARFNEVANSENWKFHVDAVVPNTRPDTARLYRTAIEFMVGGPTRIIPIGEAGADPIGYRILNKGYYANIGA